VILYSWSGQVTRISLLLSLSSIQFANIFAQQTRGNHNSAVAMARTKTRPKLHQLSPEPEQRTNSVKGTSEEKYLPAADEELGEEQMSYMTKLFLSKFSSNHERPEKLPVTRKRTPTPVETISETIEGKVETSVKPPKIRLLSSVGLDQLIDGTSNIDIPTCPNCHSEFRDAVLLVSYQLSFLS
jgi:hypothetical protein